MRSSLSEAEPRVDFFWVFLPMFSIPVSSKPISIRMPALWELRQSHRSVAGLWKDFNRIDEIHNIEEVVEPDKENNRTYEKLLPIFDLAADYQAKISESLHNLEL